MIESPTSFSIGTRTLRGIHPDQNKGQGQQGIDPHRKSNRYHVAELHIGDEHSEYQDVDHRPRAELFGEREHSAQMARRYRFVRSDQHAERADQPGEGRQCGDEENHDSKPRHVPPHQFLCPENRLAMWLIPAVCTLISGVEHMTTSNIECGQAERGDVVETVGARAPQGRRTVHTLRGHAGCQNEDSLQ
jgi:hypothetical protein